MSFLSPTIGKDKSPFSCALSCKASLKDNEYLHVYKGARAQLH